MADLLSDFELDSIKETLAQGAGHASVALSQMANHTIQVAIPELRIVRVEYIVELIGKPSDVMMSVYVNINAACDEQNVKVGSFLLLFPPKSAVRIAAMLEGQENPPEKNLDEMTEMDVSALNEVGNILTGCSLAAISDFLDVKLVEGIPVSSRDMIQASLDMIITGLAEKADNSMIFRTTLTFDSGQTRVYLFIVFEPDAVDMLRKKIKELLA